MKKKKLSCVILLILVFILSGCGKNADNETGMIPELSGENSVLLYNKYNAEFVEYDLDKNTYDSLHKDNVFQYSFKDNDCPYYTSGHSENNDFIIIKQEDNKIKKIAAVEKGTAIFPLAYDKKQHLPYYFKYPDDTKQNDDNSQHSTILSIDGNGDEQIIAEDINVGGTGVMCNGKIYYPVYNKEKDMYAVYKIEPSTGVKKRIADNVKSGDLYCAQNKVLFSDEKKIYIPDDPTVHFTKGAENYFYDDMKILVQYVVSDDATLDLVIRNYDNQILKSCKNTVGFTVDKNTVKIYRDGSTDTYKAETND